MTELRESEFDQALADSKNDLVGVFFWGHDCPNCEVAKRMLLQDAELVEALALRWFHVNTYNESELGTRFGLFGIPTFLFFHQSKKLGRISPFPGIEPFLEALTKLKVAHP